MPMSEDDRSMVRAHIVSRIRIRTAAVEMMASQRQILAHHEPLLREALKEIADLFGHLTICDNP